MRPRNYISNEMIEGRNKWLVRVSEVTGVAVDDIMGHRRDENVSTARQLVMWALCELCGYSHTQVGVLMRRNHATVTYGVNHVRWGYNGKKVDKLKEQLKYLQDGERH